MKMKMNIFFPVNGYQTLIEMDDECKFCIFYEKLMATEISSDDLSESEKIMCSKSVNPQLFNIFKDDNVYQYVIRKSLNKESKKPGPKVPKIRCAVPS
ncbi:hypothetical protein A6R68_08047, partial [Neotoma lepida]